MAVLGLARKARSSFLKKRSKRLLLVLPESSKGPCLARAAASVWRVDRADRVVEDELEQLAGGHSAAIEDVAA